MSMSKAMAYTVVSRLNEAGRPGRSVLGRASRVAAADMVNLRSVEPSVSWSVIGGAHASRDRPRGLLPQARLLNKITTRASRGGNGHEAHHPRPAADARGGGEVQGDPGTDRRG